MKKLLLLITLSLVALGCDSSVNPGPGTDEPDVLPVEVKLTWDNEADLDLMVTEPSGERIWFGSPNSSSGGRLDGDDRDGEGPETITWPAGRAPAGVYAIRVHHFDGPSPSDYTVRVSHSGQTETHNGVISAEQTRAVTTFAVGSPTIDEFVNMPDRDAPEPEVVEALKEATEN